MVLHIDMLLLAFVFVCFCLLPILDSISMDALELSIFKCIPLSSRILKLSIRRTNNNEEEIIGNTHQQRRYCCECRLSDIQSVLSILNKVRLNLFQAQTVSVVHFDIVGNTPQPLELESDCGVCCVWYTKLLLYRLCFFSVFFL